MAVKLKAIAVPDRSIPKYATFLEILGVIISRWPVSVNPLRLSGGRYQAGPLGVATIWRSEVGRSQTNQLSYHKVFYSKELRPRENFCRGF